MSELPRQASTTAAVCDRCGGTGSVVAHSHEDYGVSFESEHCETCDYGQALIRIDQLEDELREAEKMADDLGRGATGIARDRDQQVRLYEAAMNWFPAGEWERFEESDLFRDAHEADDHAAA